MLEHLRRCTNLHRHQLRVLVCTECEAGYVRYSDADSSHALIIPFPQDHTHKVRLEKTTISRGKAKEVEDFARETMKKCQKDGMGPGRVRTETLIDALRGKLTEPGNFWNTIQHVCMYRTSFVCKVTRMHGFRVHIWGCGILLMAFVYVIRQFGGKNGPHVFDGLYMKVCILYIIVVLDLYRST